MIRRFHLILLPTLSLLCVAASARAQTDVWIDTDPSIGLTGRDADDGFALVQAMRSPQIRIRGISTSWGNASGPQTFAIAREIAARFGGDTGITQAKIFAGANAATDLGQPTTATTALATALRERRLTYIALGPLTNLATLLQREPVLRDRLERVVFLGGRRPGERFRIGPWNPYVFHDANFEKDPAAAAVVLAVGMPLTFVPFGATLDCTITPADLNAIGRSSPGGAWLQQRARLWLRLWRWLFGVDGGPLFDSVAVLAVTNPELTQSAVCIPRIEPTAKPPRLVLEPTSEAKGARVVTGTRPNAKATILRRLEGSTAEINSASPSAN